jgi:8-oxo-dGTP pyrophosphatase MutT (NUDIX family)
MNWPELKARLAERLDPLGAPAGAGQSDYDLNPGWRPTPPTDRAEAAVLIPIVERPEGPTVLLTRRADALTRHAGQVAFPGGRIDPGETAEAAALREAWEEIALPPERVTLLGRSSPYETVTGFTVTPVVGVVAPPFDLRLNEAEVAEAFEAPLALLLDEGSYERRFHDGEAGRRYYYAVSHDERLIWGATAGMLRAFRARLVDTVEDAA